ncbi:hypothetical protein BC628DRAFT_924781 [Trametes gibbosa]|nr:hypothetical protein BC628DRAFT_924781 [Trametes gibbosa]
MGISLWLVPRPSQAAAIALTMRLRPADGAPLRSPASFPSFHPHVTLASGPDAGALRAALPRGQGAVPVRFAALEVGARYFMSVYVVVHGARLAALRGALGAHAGGAGVAVPRVAHLSLCYIDDADQGERARMAERLRSELRVLESGRGGERGVRLVCVDEEVEVGDGGERGVEVLEGFDGEEIWVVRCEGPVQEWEVLEKISLTG